MQKPRPRLVLRRLPSQIELPRLGPLEKEAKVPGGEKEVTCVRLAGTPHDHRAVLRRRYFDAFAGLAEAGLMPIQVWGVLGFIRSHTGHPQSRV